MPKEVSKPSMAVRCPECGIANGWHTSRCKTGLGFVAGWKARGEHKDGLRNRAEEALDELRSQLPDVVAEEDAEMRKRCAQVDAGHQQTAAFEEVMREDRDILRELAKRKSS